jgi:TonB family protein
MAYVELGQDNGGILLNLSEGGFAVQSALALTSREFSELRFQVPSLRGWLTASGRIVWMSDSKKEAGIQFTELPGEARTEIQNWVSADGVPEKSKERIPLSATRQVAPLSDEATQPGKQIFDTPYRGGGGAHEPSIGHVPHSGATRQERVAAQPEAVGGVAVAEPPAQEFHFTDYSMFAAAPEIAWAQPARRSGKWRGVVVGILVAGVFFALGATVGRGTVDHWVAYLGGWARSQYTTAPALKVTPPAPPEQLAPVDNSSHEGDTTAKAGAGDQTQAENGGTSAADNGAAGNTEVESESRSAGSGTAKSEASHSVSPRAESPSGSAARSGNVEASRRSTENAMAREGRYAEPDVSKVATGHSILVNAPEPGSPPFFVDLATEAVSASGAIAISSRRTLEIRPRSSGASSGAERVVVGKLISHSEPFYPADARSRRVQGSVQLRARVGRTGQVVGVTPVSGPLLLFPAAVAAVREWRYEPTFVNGDPAETLADITIVFRLQ